MAASSRREVDMGAIIASAGPEAVHHPVGSVRMLRG